MTPDYGVTPDGFEEKRLVDVKNELDAAFIGEFGDVNLDPQSVIGQLIGIFSKQFADIWENMQDVYLSQYPNSASGISLDNSVALNGITRIPAQKTIVIGVATGNENTLIPNGSLARVNTSNAIFISQGNTFITSSRAVKSIIEVTGLAAQEYTVVLDNISYKYSIPSLDFSGAFIPGNQINVRINGVNLPPVNYAVSSANTYSLIASTIQTFLTGSSVSVVGNSVIITPALGQQVIVNSVGITGGGPTYSLSFETALSVDDVATGLAAILDPIAKVTATASTNEITVTAVNTANPYSIVVGANLQITETSSPILFLAQEFGPIPVPANSLNTILTPVAGWISLTNYEAGITGREQETDTELRIRRLNSLRVQGAATVEAIRARLLQEVPNVTSVTIFENVTMTQSDMDVTFSIDFVTGNNIDVIIDGNTVGTVVFTTDHLTTMNLIASMIASDAEVLSATVGGVGNREIEIIMEEGENIVLSFTITLGATQPTYTISGGRPPKSFEAVVVGGTDAAVAYQIWLTKPAGIETYGNTTVIIIDSQGNNQAINFSRAVPVYLWLLMTITLNPQETFPVNGLQLISNAILNYGNSLGIGIDVILQRLEAQAFLVPGVATATATIAKTYSLSDTPIYVSTDIDIGNTEVSTWDLSRIVVNI